MRTEFNNVTGGLKRVELGCMEHRRHTAMRYDRGEAGRR